MHLVDGLVPVPVVVGCSAVAVAGVALGLRRLTPDRLPQAAMVSSVFFVASLIHVPLGPSSVHLILGGLAGMVLGTAAFPALLVALLLQAVFFGFGGLTVLGVNAVILALPAVLVGEVARRRVSRSPLAVGALAGGLTVMLSALVCAAILALSGEGLATMAQALVLAHLPVAVIEALVTAAVALFLTRVRPDVMTVAHG